MKALFVELPAFERLRSHYLDDHAFAALQKLLMASPEAGDQMPGSGGLRKLRFGDARRSKGTRGGLRVLYFWWKTGAQFWLFTLYSKGELDELRPDELARFRVRLKSELDAGVTQVEVKLAEMTARQVELKAKLPEYLETQKQQAKVQLGFDHLAAGQLAWRGFYDSLAKAVSTLEYGEDKERVFLTYAGALEQRLDVPASPNRLNLLVYINLI